MGTKYDCDEEDYRTSGDEDNEEESLALDYGNTRTRSVNSTKRPATAQIDLKSKRPHTAWTDDNKNDDDDDDNDDEAPTITPIKRKSSVGASAAVATASGAIDSTDEELEVDDVQVNELECTTTEIGPDALKQHSMCTRMLSTHKT